jgi:hypothetical protein
MNRFKIKISALAVSIYFLGSIAAVAFAESSMPSITNSSTDTSVNESHRMSWFGENNPFEDFFDNFFKRKLKATMDGTQEVPGPGDPDGTGEARLKIKLNKDQLCVDVETKYIDTPTAAHIHNAPKGAAGAVVVPLPVPNSEGEIDECIHVENSLLKVIRDNPEDYYVNVHTSAYPDGAVRGQLSR